MNYYNPYFNMYPYMTNTITKPSLIGRLTGGLKSINFSSILSGTQKTLNIVNQTIPLVKQTTPIIKNAKTMFKVMNEFKRVDTPKKKNAINNVADSKNDNNDIIKNDINEGPTFFL